MSSSLLCWEIRLETDRRDGFSESDLAQPGESCMIYSSGAGNRQSKPQVSIMGRGPFFWPFCPLPRPDIIGLSPEKRRR